MGANIGPWWGTEQAFEHGWPWVYLRRRVIYTSGTAPEYPPSGIPWLYQSAWSFQGDGRELRPWVLAADVLAGLAVLGLVAAAAEWRRRRHRRFWQFSVAEMLATTCLVAAGLGWYQYNKQVYQRERKLASNDDWPDLSKIDYRGPLWLQRLAGDRNLQWLRRVTGVTLVGQAFGDEELKRRVEEIKTLSSLESLWIYGSGVSDAGLECLAKLPQLRTLSLSSPLVTDAGLKHLRELKQLESLTLQHIGVDDAGLVHLRGLANLRNLDLTGTNVEGPGLVHLKILKNLEFVGLVNTPVKMEHVEQLRKSLPNCEVVTHAWWDRQE
jgi:hypothetical protein